LEWNARWICKRYYNRKGYYREQPSASMGVVSLLFVLHFSLLWYFFNAIYVRINRWLGDRVYMFVRRCLSGFRRQRVPGSNPPRYYRLTGHQSEYNAVIGHYRSRVEQVIGNCKNHNAMSKGGLAFRGDLLFLEAIIAVTMHATAAMLEQETQMQPCPFPNPLYHAGWAH